MCVCVVMKDLLAWVYEFAYVTINFVGNEVKTEGSFGVMWCVCDWLGHGRKVFSEKSIPNPFSTNHLVILRNLTYQSFLDDTLFI